MKKLLLSLFVGFVGIISFCSAGSITYTGMSTNGVNIYVPYNSSITQGGNPNLNISCNVKPEQIGRSVQPYIYFEDGTAIDYGSQVLMDPEGFSFSYDSTKQVVRVYFKYYSSSHPIIYTCTFNGDNILGSSSCPECPTCPEINTGEILSGYILESEIDINYCVGNGLCPNECGSGTDFSGDLQYSNIYINSILHPGEENIFIDIPDYIQWDYSVTTGEFNVYVGSGYDMDYMNSIIKINSYRPTSSDFTNIFVSGLTLIFPYIFVLLLIIFMWKLIKRIFK